jgi:hypothetical protein
MADLLVQRLRMPRFSWGSASLIDTGEVRNAYLEALRTADRHNIALLLAFART